MASPTPITENVIRDAIVSATQSVFRTMLKQDITLVDRQVSIAVAAPDQVGQILGSVGFVGKANGTVYLGMDNAFGKVLTGQLLGMSVAEIDSHGEEVLIDAIGEMTNMTVGGFKNALCDLGHPCMLTLPTIVLGNNLSVAQIKGTTRHIFRFASGGQPFTADIQIKNE